MLVVLKVFDGTTMITNKQTKSYALNVDVEIEEWEELRLFIQ